MYRFVDMCTVTKVAQAFVLVTSPRYECEVIIN